MAPNKDIDLVIDALLDRTEERRVVTTAGLVAHRQRELGQFFTPRIVAERIAAEPRLHREGTLRVLDPGAGSGSLSAALAARGFREQPQTAIHVTAVEFDQELIGSLTKTLEDCRLTGRDIGVQFEYKVLHGDFVQWASQFAGNQLPLVDDRPEFDLVIQNPPYRKVPRASRVRSATAELNVDATNLYVAFLALSANLLSPGGQLVAITPRSFANGPYFRSFRKWFLSNMGLDRIDVFQDRGKLFEDLSVLQENVIIASTRGAHPEKVAIATSRGYADPVHEHMVPYEDVVRPNDAEAFIHIPTDIDDTRIALAFRGLPSELSDLGIQVSTGRVVDFRAKEALRASPEKGSVPLIYPGHLQQGRVVWPIQNYKKANAISIDDSTTRLLNPPGIYVAVKRFSAKEEARRVVATVVRTIDLNCDAIGFENHLNVFHDRGAGMKETLAIGLAVWLNSNLFDSHYRQFSGHTQVNATDLRNVKYPALGQLVRMGDAVQTLRSWPTQDEIDELVEEHVFGGVDITEWGGSMDHGFPAVQEARKLLEKFNFDAERHNERSALVLRALLGLSPDSPWTAARDPMLRTVEIMDFLRQHYQRDYKPNTRETIRRKTLHQFAAAGLIVQNPDQPDRPINSPHWCYQITESALAVIRIFGSAGFEARLNQYLSELPGQLDAYASARDMLRIPVALPDGRVVSLSPGGQNELLRAMVHEFCERFTPGGEVLYVGDAIAKLAHLEEARLAELGIVLDPHGKIPDLIVHMKDRNWLVLLEAAPAHGPVDAKRHGELKTLFAGSTAGLVFVSCFPSRVEMRKYLHEIAWETEVWCAEDPTHLIHFNGERFLGPYDTY